MKNYNELLALITQRGVHAVFGDAGEGWGIEQNAAELAEFLVICQELQISSVLEIGTGYKAGLARFLNDDMQWHVTSIDIKDYGHSFSGITFISDTIAGFEYPVFQDKFDLVIIDGDHTYDAVKFDHDYYSKYAAKVIAFHDIAGLRDCQGVRDYWNAIAFDDGSLLPGYHEIIADTPQRGGIGYVVVAEVTAPTVAKTATVARKPAAPRKRTSLASKGNAKKKTAAKKPAARTAVKK